MKAYTDISQSKKLAEILPHNTADNTWERIAIAGSNLNVPEELQYVHNGDMPFCFYSGVGIPCWSLAALRACLPPGISIDGILYVFESHNTFDNMWVYEYKFEDISAPLYSKSLNKIDAAVDMIIQLKENKMI